MLGNGEVLRTTEVCVSDLLDETHYRKHCISHTSGKHAGDCIVTTFPSTIEEPGSPCPSLLIIMEQQPSIKSKVVSDHDKDNCDEDVS